MATDVPVVSAKDLAVAPIRGDSFAILKALSEGAAVFVALSFVGGWSYLSAYYRTFGLNPLEFEFSLPVVCTSALYALYQAEWPLYVGGVLVAAMPVIARRIPGNLRGWIAATISILFVGVAALGAFEGRVTANVDMLDDPNSEALPYVAFATKLEFKGAARPSCVEWNSLGAPDCKLLAHYKGTYYFFKPVAKKGQANLLLYALSESDLLATHIQRGLERNERQSDVE